MPEYRRNHYVPIWYQKKFIPEELIEKRFWYLDLKPEICVSNGHRYTRNSLLHWGPDKCFYQDDLYTTKFDDWESTEIEQKFFGKIDDRGKEALDYWYDFVHPSVNAEALHTLLPYMSVQKLRTPKGLAAFGKLLNEENKNNLLIHLQRLQQMYCALWTECVWAIADASESETKFLLSDHPITVYNSGCYPASKYCEGFNDPGIWLSGTHTLFPLGLDKILILTNLSWVRNPYGNPIKPRPHPKLFRAAMFNFMDIQTGRMLTDTEVNEINYIIKMRANRYVAAVNKEWLFPEKRIPKTNWPRFGKKYLLMPDPRSVKFTGEVIVGYESKRADVFDEYGRRPDHRDFKNKQINELEWETFHAFQGEFARLFGRQRRGMEYEIGGRSITEDSESFHAYHLRLEQTNKKHRYNQ